MSTAETCHPHCRTLYLVHPSLRTVVSNLVAGRHHLAPDPAAIAAATMAGEWVYATVGPWDAVLDEAAARGWDHVVVLGADDTSTRRGEPSGPAVSCHRSGEREEPWEIQDGCIWWVTGDRLIVLFERPMAGSCVEGIDLGAATAAELADVDPHLPVAERP